MEEKATDKQIGGSHYKMAIQPVEFIMKNNLDFCTGNCIKYLCRHRQKNGIEDLEKAKHYIDLLIEMEYPMGNNGVRFNPINKEESNIKLL